jgi:hypothetical protein
MGLLGKAGEGTAVDLGRGGGDDAAVGDRATPRRTIFGP